MKPSMLRIYCLRAKRSEDENENAENKNIQVKRFLDSMVYGEKVAGLMGHTVATVWASLLKSPLESALDFTKIDSPVYSQGILCMPEQCLTSIVYSHRDSSTTGDFKSLWIHCLNRIAANTLDTLNSM